MKLKFNIKELIRDDRFLKIISLILAVAAWFVVAIVVSPETDAVIEDVPVNIDVQASALSKLGLNPIETSQQSVDILIKGERLVVGSVQPSDITVAIVLTGVAGPGTYDLELQGIDKNDKGFEVVQIRPNTVRVKFDKLITKKFPVELDIDGLTIPDGYIMEKEYATPFEITVEGPGNDIEKISKCVARVEIKNALNRTTVVPSDVVLLDDQENEIDSSNMTLSAESVNITFPVLKKKHLPVTLRFTNVPKDFPLSQLKYTLSNETIEVAGPVDKIDSYTEIDLGYVDLKTLDFENDYEFDVTLPANLVNIENVQSVFVDFNRENKVSAQFDVSSIYVINQPEESDITVSSKLISDVTIIGDEEIINSMTAGDLVAEIDLSSRTVSPGQYKVPATIYAPGKGLVWALGEYSAVITVK